MSKRIDIEVIRRQGLELGLTLLSETFRGTNFNVRWACPNGHETNSSWCNVKVAGGCTRCSRLSVYERNSVDTSKLHAKAESHGGKFIEIVHINGERSALWECKRGHRFNLTWGIANSKKRVWCALCAAPGLAGLSYYESIAKTKGGRLVSNPSEYKTSHSKVTWECKKGHQWATKAYAVKNSWCAVCRKGTANQFEIYEMVKKRFPDALFNKRSILPYKRLELDIWIPSLNKAIEYDGRGWHEKPEAQERDRKKNQMCKDVGIALLRVDSIDYAQCRIATLRKIAKFLAQP